MTALAKVKPLFIPHHFLEVLEVLGDYDQALDHFHGDLEEKQEYVTFYKDKLPWFREGLDINLTLGKRAGGSSISLEKLYDFLAEYENTGMRVAAAKAAGTTWYTIKRRITKGDKFYLADFAHAYQAVEDEKNTELKDLVYQKARNGEEANSVDITAARLALSNMGGGKPKKGPTKIEKRDVNLLIQNVTERAGLTGKVIQVS